MPSNNITNPSTGRFMPKPVISRLVNQSVFDLGTGCWEWQGKMRGDTGYGEISVEGRKRLVHRVAAMLWLGFDIDSPLKVLHSCDNRICINPDHLFPGTSQDNATDRDEKGRGARGERSGVSKLTASDVQAIRLLVRDGATQYAVAKQFGVARPTISHIMSGRTWKHI